MRNRVLLLVSLVAFPLLAQTPRTRARDVGIVVGVLPPGPLDAITDVAGVRVGHVTIAQGDSINTGVTAILPHDGNVFRDKVPAAIVVGNGFGKLMGATQVNASRRLPRRLGGWTIGVLVQSNFGGVLTINGAPVGQELGQYYLKGMVSRTTDDGERITADGSVILVVATDAPLDHRQLERLGRRALAGLARTGSSMSNGSGDYVISFSSRRIVG